LGNGLGMVFPYGWGGRPCILRLSFADL